jgi:hypothetical protein
MTIVVVGFITMSAAAGTRFIMRAASAGAIAQRARRMIAAATAILGTALLGCGCGTSGGAPAIDADASDAGSSAVDSGPDAQNDSSTADATISNEDAAQQDSARTDATRPRGDAAQNDASPDVSSDGGATGCGTPATAIDAGLSLADIFKRALISRAYEQHIWVLRDPDGGADREDAAAVAAALAGLRPSYISGLVYLENGTTVTQRMIDDYGVIRAAARAANANAKLDVEISLNPSPPSPKEPFADASALVAQMTVIDCQLHPDAWMFDFYSDAQKVHPDWVAAAIAYAHAHGQLVGGNVFGGMIPPGSDFAAFVDDAVDGGFGFDFRQTEIASLRQSSPSTLLVAHLQSNPQNGPTTESCVYSYQWDEPTRAEYLSHWATSQADAGFGFIYPVFYPLCPGGIAFDSTRDLAPDGGTLYEAVDRLMSKYNR